MQAKSIVACEFFTVENSVAQEIRKAHPYPVVERLKNAAEMRTLAAPADALQNSDHAPPLTDSSSGATIG